MNKLSELLHNIILKEDLCTNDIKLMNPIKAYFLGRENLLNEIIKQVESMQIVEQKDFDDKFREGYEKGFAKGKELIKTNLKICLKELNLND